MFSLHPQLASDSIWLGTTTLCELLLMDDVTYPWFVLVPRREDISEIYQLNEADQMQLWRESSQLSRSLATLFCADKMNVAALGNVVPQLHLHHIVRFRHDPAWPAPVWGKTSAVPYSAMQRQALIDRLLPVLGDYLQIA